MDIKINQTSRAQSVTESKLISKLYENIISIEWNLFIEAYTITTQMQTIVHDNMTDSIKR